MVPDTFSFDAFLSHNREDKPRVRTLAERLRTAGLRVWFDEWNIRPGDNIYLAVEKGLEQSRSLILCLSSAALGSDWVGLERSTALFRNPSNSQRRFIPILLGDCKLPDTLQCFKYVDYRSDSEAGFEELLGACVVADPKPSTSLNSDELKCVRRLFDTRRSEWARLRSDFEREAAKYSDLQLKLFFVLLDSPPPDVKFEQPSYAINLWQYYGSGENARERLKSLQLTDFGVTGAEVSAFGALVGKEAELFRKMANRAGSLLSDEIVKVVADNVFKMFENPAAGGKPIAVTNKNPLAKWLNFILIATIHAHPERVRSDTLAVDPFAASLTAFDLFLPRC